MKKVLNFKSILLVKVYMLLHTLDRLLQWINTKRPPNLNLRVNLPRLVANLPQKFSLFLLLVLIFFVLHVCGRLDTVI